ncbi:MAG TPA: MoaD/ThiS family protein [Aldersonia sp.]
MEVRYFAAAADAAGCAKETLTLPDSPTVRDVDVALRERHGAGMARVLSVAAYLVGDELTRDPDFAVGAAVDVLPPFAGG